MLFRSLKEETTDLNKKIIKLNDTNIKIENEKKNLNENKDINKNESGHKNENEIGKKQEIMQ